MGTAVPIQTNFTAGELSSRVDSRVDIAKYGNGLKVGENLQYLVQGGARRRPGSRWVAEVKHSDKWTRLITFKYNRDQAYMLEVGNLYMRVFKDGARVGSFEIVTPYTEDMLDDIGFVQGADTMFLVHPEVPVQRLQRFGDDNWRILPAPFFVEPFDELGETPTVALALTSATVGAGRTFTGVACFFASDVGRDIVAGSGLATITGYTNNDTVTCEIKSQFAGTGISAGGWSITGTPQTSCTSSVASPVGTGVTATLGAGGWRPGNAEVGKFIKINGGLIKITSYVSNTVVNGTIQEVLTSATAAITNSWTLNKSIWGGANGYPRAVALDNQRLLLAGSPGHPQTLVGSRIGDVLDFEIGSADDAAFSRELATSEIAPIQHLVQGRRLMVFTSSNEMSVRGGVEKPITPTSIQKNDESTAGSNFVRPVKIGNEILFVQRAGRKIRACGYRYDIDGFDSPDRTVFSEHITESGIVDMCFQQEPDAQLTCVRADGQMAVAAYDTEQEVNAWGRWTTQGLYEYCAAMPTATSEQTWSIVQRTIDGNVKRYIEYFDPTLKTDCAMTATDGTAKTTWTGFGHLEGKTVKVLADGIYQGEQVVTGGQIVLTRTANAVEVGLGYTPLMTLKNPEVGNIAGTSQGASISVGNVVVRVLDTVGIVVNNRITTDFRRMNAELLDRPPEVGSGDLREVTLSDDLYKNELTISQPEPVAFHILAVIRKCTVND
ncbi:MAG: hypothetical protein V4639_03275 [Pseudomonadota bacterium]